jgi:hypothetical protein
MPKALFGLVLVANAAAAAGAGAIARWNAVVMGLVLVLGAGVVGFVVRRSQRDLLAFKREHKRWPTMDELDDWNQEIHCRRAKARAVASAARTAKTAQGAYAQRVAQAESALQTAQRQYEGAVGSVKSGLASAERAHAHAIAEAAVALEAWRNPGMGPRIAGFRGIDLYQHALAVKGASLPLLHAQAAAVGNRLIIHMSAKQEVVKLSKQDFPAALQFASHVTAAASAEMTFQQQRPAAIPAAERYLNHVTADTSAIEAGRLAVVAAQANPTLLGAIRDAAESLAAIRADTREIDSAQEQFSAEQERDVERSTSAPPPTWRPHSSNAVMSIVGIAVVWLFVGGTGAAIVRAPATPAASATATAAPSSNSVPTSDSAPTSNPASSLPSPRTNRTASAGALGTAISSAGFGCNDFKADSQAPFAATQGRCHAGADEFVLAQYSTTDQRDQHAGRLRGLLAGLDADHYLVIGDNWLINVGTNKDLTAKLATTFGATIVTIPKGTPSQTNDTAAGLQAAKKACTYYSQGVDPVIVQAVARNDGALIIRAQFGVPPNGGPVDANAPWFLMNSAAITAASYDPKYSALTGRIETLNRAIDAISPSRMSATLADVAAAGQAVQRYCAGLA